MELTIEQALQQGVAAHKEGKLRDAERFYQAILQSQPKHPDANHNLGLIAVFGNKTSTALPLFKIALDANPKVEQFWLSYIEALIKGEQFENVKLVIEQAKKQGLAKEKIKAFEVQLKSATEVGNTDSAEPSQQQVSTLLEYYQNGKYGDAEQLAVFLTKRFPTHPFSWKVLGAVFKQTGRQSKSLSAMQKSAQLAPHDAEARYNSGIVLQELGRLDEAIASYTQSIALKSDYAEAHNNLGNTLNKLGRLNEAEASYRQVIALKPDFTEAHNNLGNTLQGLDRLKEAEASYARAITLKPDYAEAHSGLGVTLKELGRLGEAEASYRQAIALKPDYAEAHSNLGNTLKELGRLDEAEANLKRAIALKYDYAEVIYNLSTVQSYMDNLEGEIVSLQAILQIDSHNYGLRAGVNLAICHFLNGNFADSKKNLLAAKEITGKTSPEFKNGKVYWRYLSSILSWHEEKSLDFCNLKTDKTLHVIGESHSLGCHNLLVKSSGSDVLCRAKLIKGCKQWHLGNSTRNQYKNQFESAFYSIPKLSEVLLVIGEIDCRLDGGILKHKRKFPEKEIEEIILTTVENFLTYVAKTNSGCRHNIIIQGVPCPNINIGKCTEEELTQLIEVIKRFNYELEYESKEKGFEFIDVYRLTDRGDGFSSGKWHIDSIHLSPEGFLEAWSKKEKQSVSSKESIKQAKKLA
jgi:tetratricopeptide (TPR) repeat protein